MSATPPPPTTDAAMLTWLAGDDKVQAAADRVWTTTGRITAATAELNAAQADLKTATDAYTEAIRACRIPAEHVERLGAALILRIGRAHILVELNDLDDLGPADNGHTP